MAQKAVIPKYALMSLTFDHSKVDKVAVAAEFESKMDRLVTVENESLKKKHAECLYVNQKNIKICPVRHQTSKGKNSITDFEFVKNKTVLYELSKEM